MILAIDYGEKYIGIANSDESNRYAGPLTQLEVKSMTNAVNKVKEVAEKYNPELIVVGVPYTFSKNLTAQAKTNQIFIQKLQEALNIKVIAWDESYSTKISEAGKKGKAKKNSHAEAAAVILQSYLDENNN